MMSIAYLRNFSICLILFNAPDNMKNIMPQECDHA